MISPVPPSRIGIDVRPSIPIREGGTGEIIYSQAGTRSEEHTSELQSPDHLVCRLLLEKKKKYNNTNPRTSHQFESQTPQARASKASYKHTAKSEYVQVSTHHNDQLEQHYMSHSTQVHA